MSAVIPFPGVQLCDCGNAVANFPIAGGYACEACANLRTLQANAAEFSATVPEAPVGPTLDEILNSLTQVKS